MALSKPKKSFEYQGAAAECFIFEYQGNAVSWRPDFKKAGKGNFKNGRYHFNKLRQSLNKQFGRQNIRKLPIIYNIKHENNRHYEQLNTSTICNELNDDTFVDFWNELKNSKNGSVMNFVIGVNEVDGLKIGIISPQSLNCGNFRTWYFMDDAGTSDDIDWEMAYKRVIMHLNQLTKSPNEVTTSNISTMDVEYDQLKYVIYRVENDEYDAICNNNDKKLNALIVSNYVSTHDLSTMVEDGDELEDCFEDRKCCILFVENKHYFLIKNGGICGEWHPQWSDNDNDEIDWESQFENLKSDICSKLGLVNNDKLNIHFGDEPDLDIDDSGDFEQKWEDMVEDDIKQTILVVNGEMGVDAASKQLVMDDNKEMVDNLVNVDQPPPKHHPEKEHKQTTTEIIERKMDSSHADQEYLWEEVEMSLKTTFDKMTCTRDNKFVCNDMEKEMNFLANHLFARNQIATARIRNKLRSFQISQESKKMLKLMFENLLKSMKIEGHNPGIDTYDNILKARSECIDKNSWDTSFKWVKLSLTEIRPFDIAKMLALDEKTNEASKQVEGEDILLVLGHTGAGKSTSIHFLAGSTMKQDARTGHIDAAKPAPGTEGIATTFKLTESVTRYISSVPLPLQGIMRRGSDIHNNRMYICDTPGFDDSSGAEVDVANGIGIVKAVRRANRVKILLVICEGDLEHRCKGLKQLAITLGEILPQMESHLAAIDFVFTKVSGPNPCELVKSKFEQVVAELDSGDSQVETSESLNILIEHITDRADANQLIVLNPLKDDRKAVLKQLLHKSRGWIPYPNGEFREFTTDSSRQLITQQILKHKENIVKSSRHHEYQSINNKLNELKDLYNVLREKSIVDQINQCVNIVCTEWNQRCNEATRRLKTNWKKGSIKEFNGDLVHYRNVMNDIKINEMFRKTHLIYKMAPNNSNNEEKEEKVKQVPLNNTAQGLQFLCDILEKEFTKICDECHFNVTNENLGKLTQMKQIFPNLFETKFDKKIKEMMQERMKTENKCNAALKENKFGEYTGILAELRDVVKIVKQYNDPCKVELLLNQLETKLLQQLESFCKYLTNMFKLKNGFKPKPQKRMTVAKCYFERLRAAQDACVRNNNRVYDECNRMHNESEEFMVQYCKLLINHVTEVVWNDCDSSTNASNDTNTYRKQTTIVDIHDYVNYLNQLRSFFDDDNQWKTSEGYHSLLQQIIGKLDVTFRRASEIIRVIENDPQKAQYDELVDCVVEIKNSDWVFDLAANNDNGTNNKKAGNRIFKEMEKKLRYYMETLLNEVNNVTIKLGNQECLKFANNIMNQLKKMSKLNQLLPDVTEMSNRIVQQIESDVVSVLYTIEKEFNLSNKKREKQRKLNKQLFIDNFNMKKANESIAFINGCLGIKWIRLSPNDNDKENNSQEKSEEKQDKQDEKKEQLLERNVNIYNVNIQQIVHETDDILEKHIELYGKTIIEEISNIFEMLMDIDKNVDQEDSKNNENENKPFNGNLLDNKANDLSNMLNNLCRIEKRYPLLLKELLKEHENIISEWPNKFNQGLTQFGTKVSGYKNSNRVKFHIGTSRAHALSKIDWYLKNKADCPNGFASIYYEHQKTFQDNVGYNEIVDAIKENDFFKVGTAFGSLRATVAASGKGSHGRAVQAMEQQAQKLLVRKMDEMFTKARLQVIKLPNEINLDEIEALHSHLNQIKEAKLYCMQYLTNQDEGSLIKIEKNTSKLLNEWMARVLDNVNQLIRSCQFEKAANKIEAIKTISGFMPVSSDNEKEEPPFTKLENDMIAACNDLQKQYCEIELEGKEYNPYTLHPLSTLYKHLKPVIDKKDIFRTTWDAINENVMKKFRQELRAARDCDDENRSRILRLCDSILRSLPEITKTILETDLKHCKQDIKDKNENYKKELERWHESKNYIQMCNMLKHHVKSHNDRIAQDITNTVLADIGQLENELNDNFAQSNAKEVNIKCNRINQICAAFIDNNEANNINGNNNGGELKDRINKIRMALHSKYSKICDRVRMTLESSDINTIKEAEREIEFLVKLTQNEQSSENNDEKKKLLDELKRDFLDHFKNLEKKFEQAVLISDTFGDTVLDLDNGKQVIEILQLYQHSSMFKKLGIEKSVFKYENGVDELYKRLLNCFNSVMDQEFKNIDATRNSEQRKDYFQRIERTLSILMNASNEKYVQFCQNHLKVDISQQYLSKIWTRFASQIEDLQEEIFKQLKIIPPNEEVFKTIDLNYNILLSFQSVVIRAISKAAAQFYDKIVGKANEAVTKSKRKIEKLLEKTAISCQTGDSLSNVELFGERLIQLQMASELLFEFRDTARNYVTQCLNKYKKQPQQTNIAALSVGLSSMSPVWGGMIVSHHAIFRGLVRAQFDQMTKDQGIEDVCLKIRAKDTHVSATVDTTDIRNHFKTVMKKYEELIKRYLTPGLKYKALTQKYQELISNCKILAEVTKKLVYRFKQKKKTKMLHQMKTKKAPKKAKIDANSLKYRWDTNIKSKLVCVQYV